MGSIKNSLNDWKEILEAYKKYNEELRKLNKAITQGVSPSQVQRVLKDGKNQEQLLANMIQRRAANLEKAGGKDAQL